MEILTEKSHLAVREKSLGISLCIKKTHTSMGLLPSFRL